jgi:hypothetical protein
VRCARRDAHDAPQALLNERQRATIDREPPARCSRPVR